MTTVQNMDSEGIRIKTNILVSGYIRQLAKEYDLFIPEDIRSICFEYWLIKANDEWDTKYIARSVEINDETVTCRGDRGTYASVYGSVSIGKGIWSWQLKLKSENVSIRIGIIEDDDNILNKYLNVSLHKRFGTRVYLWSDNGAIYYGTNAKFYSSKFIQNSGKDTIITLILNMDKCCIKYNVNDEENDEFSQGIVKDKKYRFVINADNGCVVELL